MRARHPSRRSRTGEKGYVILLMMFILALLVLSTVALAPNLKTDDRREKEEEMIWRGKQYVRGIRLFYQKNHRFPTQLDDLYKPKTGIRFMRQAFKDPMNPVDGSWRLIYVGPNGQLMGSLKVQSNIVNLTGQSATTFGGSSSTSPASPFGSTGNTFSSGSTSGNSFSQNSNSFGSQSPSSTLGNPAQGTTPSGAPGADNSGAAGDNSTQQSLAASYDTGTVIGGNIIGVGSKVNKKSFKWYEKSKNYRLFEFIWDPSVDSVTGQRLGQIPQNNAPLTNPTGGTTSTPTPSPVQNPNLNPDPGSSPPLQAPPPN